MAKPLNDKFKDIKDEALQTARDAKFADLKTALANENPSPEEVAAAEALAGEVTEYDTEIADRSANSVEAAAKFADLQKQFSEAPAEDEGDEGDAEAEGADEGADAGEAEAEVKVEVDADAKPAEAQSAATKVDTAKMRTIQTLAGKTKRPAVPAEQDATPSVSIVAAADSGFAAGAKLEFSDLAQGAINRLKGMPAPNGDGNTTGDTLRQFPVATLEVPFASEYVIDHRTSDEQTFEIIEAASDEHSIKNRQGDEFDSLVAANGWCAPSETLYDLAADESLDGILSLPEVQVNRGGIRYTTGPQFADFYANAGFVQTEAQAIAGTTKPCYEVTCPSFTDVRLDAVGVCIKVPILLNAGYPEMVNRFTSGTLIAHQHMVNLNVINRMVALSTVRNAAAEGLGSVASDTIEVLEIVINQRRQSQRLAFDRTVEVAVPFWLRGALRADLSRRIGAGVDAVTNAQVDAHFAAINANIQYVYDWQPLAATATDLSYPATFKALVYPAGTFVKGVSNVINLSAVYDAASLAGNMYTGLFMEQGLLVAKKQYGSDIVELPICTAGRTGASDFTCA